MAVALTRTAAHEADGIRVEYHPDDDAAYVTLAQGSVYFTVELHDDCMLDYSEDGLILGVEFLGVSRGVQLEGVPRPQAVANVLQAAGIEVRPMDGRNPN